MESDTLNRPESPLHKVLCCIMPSGSSQCNSSFLCGRIDSGLQKLITSLNDVTQRPNCKDLDFEFLKNMLESPDMQNLFKLHEKVTTPEETETTAITNSASSLRKDIEEDLEISSAGKESKELLQLLGTTHLKALLEAHDQIAAKDFLPKLPDIPHEVDEDDGVCVKAIQLIKGDTEPLGATIQMAEGEKNSVRVARVMHGGAADRAGLFEVGDEVKEVNGHIMEGKSPNEVLKLLSKTTGPISLKLSPGGADKGASDGTRVKVRTCFSYNPYEDSYTPCPEAGLSFKKGDILHIVSKEDAWWWQARKDGDSAVRAGLIPSRLLAEKLKGSLQAKENNKENRNISDEKQSRFSPRLMKKSKKPRKYMDNDYTHHPEVYYEDVELYYPTSRFHRPMVLVGPSALHLDKLVEQATKTHPDLFTIPYLCSNEPKSEIKSPRVRNVTAQELEKFIRDKKILEHEERGGYFYAMTDDEIKGILHSGKTCIMTCKPETIHNLRRGDIKPYVVLVKPSPQDKTRLSGIPRRGSKESDITKSLEECSHIEDLYGYCIDTILTYSKSTGDMIKNLVDLVQNINTKPSWISASWTSR